MDRFPTFKNIGEDELLNRVDVWTKDLQAYEVPAEFLDECYKKALDIRLREDPTNRFPMGVYEIIRAWKEIKTEEQEFARRESIEQQGSMCQECVWAAQANIECRKHGWRWRDDTKSA